MIRAITHLFARFRKPVETEEDWADYAVDGMVNMMLKEGLGMAESFNMTSALRSYILGREDEAYETLNNGTFKPETARAILKQFAEGMGDVRSPKLRAA